MINMINQYLYKMTLFYQKITWIACSFDVQCNKINLEPNTWQFRWISLDLVYFLEVHVAG